MAERFTNKAEAEAWAQRRANNDQTAHYVRAVQGPDDRTFYDVDRSASAGGIKVAPKGKGSSGLSGPDALRTAGSGRGSAG